MKGNVRLKMGLLNKEPFLFAAFLCFFPFHFRLFIFIIVVLSFSSLCQSKQIPLVCVSVGDTFTYRLHSSYIVVEFGEIGIFKCGIMNNCRHSFEMFVVIYPLV